MSYQRYQMELERLDWVVVLRALKLVELMRRTVSADGSIPDDVTGWEGREADALQRIQYDIERQFDEIEMKGSEGE